MNHSDPVLAQLLSFWWRRIEEQRSSNYRVYSKIDVCVNGVLMTDVSGVTILKASGVGSQVFGGVAFDGERLYSEGKDVTEQLAGKKAVK